jgi:hypothetical protein
MTKIGPVKFVFNVIDGMIQLGVITTFAEFWLRQSKQPPSDIAILIGTYDVPVSQAPYIVLDVKFGLPWFKRTVSGYVADTSTLVRAGKSPSCGNVC